MSVVRPPSAGVAPNGEPVHPLPCFALGHVWSGWSHDAEAMLSERWCEREGCGQVQVRRDWEEGGEA